MRRGQGRASPEYDSLNYSAEILVLTTPQELFSAAAEEVVRSANESVSERGRFTIALSGGSTPKSLYNLLATNARTTLPWDKMYFFWGDERHVPPTDPESNYRMVHEAMLSKLPVPPGNVFRFPAENPDAAAAAEAYEKTLRKFFQLAPDAFPRFDLIRDRTRSLEDTYCPTHIVCRSGTPRVAMSADHHDFVGVVASPNHTEGVPDLLIWIR